MLLVLATPLVARAQPPGKIAFLCPGSCSNLPHPVNSWDQGFLSGLERAGYVLGRNATLNMTGVGVGYGRLPDAAKKLVQRKVDVIVAVGNEATRAARQVTKSTPIVMLNVADAVDEGLVASLGRRSARERASRGRTHALPVDRQPGDRQGSWADDPAIPSPSSGSRH